MEKAIYVMWRPPGTDGPAFAAGVRHELAAQLLAVGARGLQLNLVDEDVLPAWGGRLALAHQPPDGVLSLWLDSASPAARRPYEEIMAGYTARLAGYLVTESEPLRNTTHPPQAGQRTWGFAQIAFLRRPAALTVDEFLERWLEGQTAVAVETQSTFRYVQNVVSRPLTPEDPPLAGIVEECFPIEAMTDLHSFYDAVGDDERLAKNMERMMDSVGRFSDPGQIEVIWTSQFVLLDPTA
jgi:hypothetical protein